MHSQRSIGTWTCWGGNGPSYPGYYQYPVDVGVMDVYAMSQHWVCGIKNLRLYCWVNRFNMLPSCSCARAPAAFPFLSCRAPSLRLVTHLLRVITIDDVRTIHHRVSLTVAAITHT
jgi:hypothetical protein